MPYAIETVNLTKVFTRTRTLSDLLLHPFRKLETTLAVSNINLQIEEGKLFGLVGPNGAGKTTLIKILCCLILPTQGTAKVAGYDISTQEEKVKASIGLVSGDERSFYWRLTGRQNLEFFATLHNLSPGQIRRRIDELAQLLELRGDLDKRFQVCSTGIKQRLVIARSLLNNAKILFMDEPTKSLDPIAASILRKFIKERLSGQEKKTIVFATHNLQEAEILAERIAIMDKGKIIALGNIGELRKNLETSCSSMEEVFNSYVSQ